MKRQSWRKKKRYVTSPGIGKLGPPPGARTGGCHPVGPPPAGIGIGVGCSASRAAGEGGDLGVLIPGIAVSWHMEPHLSGGEGTGAGAVGGAVSTRYSWAHLIA